MFNVTQAILAWLNGEPNLGLLVTASNLFENKVSIEFSRRNDYHHNKQPILVLFDNVNSNHNRSSKPSYGNQIDKEDREIEKESKEEESEEKEDYKEEEKEDEEINMEDYSDYNEPKHYSKFKRLRKDGQPEKVLLAVRREPEFFQRQKRRRERKNKKREKNESDDYDDSQDLESETWKRLGLEAAMKRRRRDVASFKKHTAGIVSKNHTKKIPRILTSMDIYERAEFRERLGRRTLNQSITRQRRSIDNENTITIQPNTTETCTRHELYVDFQDIGLSSIIAPPGYSAYQCKGVCESPLSQDQRPTNHATIQAIVHKVGLVKDVEKPCCVPIKLQSTSILFFDNENVVLKTYEDMVAERCGCR